MFDDQSTITADPLFDFSGKPISYLNVAFGGGRGIDGEQFDLLVPNTVGQSTPSEDGAIPSQQCRFPRCLCRCVARRGTSVGAARSGRTGELGKFPR